MTRRDWTILLASVYATLFYAICVCVSSAHSVGHDPVCGILICTWVLAAVALFAVIVHR